MPIFPMPRSAPHGTVAGLHDYRPLECANILLICLRCSPCSGCTEPNDVVGDTAEMANPQFDCSPVNSCPNRPDGQGTTDPIHNIMVRHGRSLS